MESTTGANVEASVRPATAYKDLNDFLIKHLIQKGGQVPNVKKPTNTRIPDPGTNIYGGSYYIPDAEYPVFLQLYYRDVIAPKKKEYLTEAPRENDGPILVDLDIKHEYDVDERQYSKEHIEDMVDIYLEAFKEMYQPDDDTNFNIFVLEKPSVNRVESKKITKDGIHIIIGVQADHVTQRILRQKVMPKVAEAWADLPITNSWDDVFDSGISAGFTNWQLIGSRKPNHDRYQLTHIYDVTFDTTDGEFRRPEIPLSDFDIGKNIHKLSVRSKAHASLFMKNSFISEYEEYKRVNKIGGAGGVLPASAAVARQQRLDMIADDHSAISRIRNQEDLDLLLNNLLDNITPTEYDIKDAYDYVMILPVSYYGVGSYTKWIRVGWVLRNTSNKLLIVWLAFSAKAPLFQFSSIPELCDQWRKFDLRKHDGLNKRSLIYWARCDAPEEYKQVHRNSIDYFIEITINCNSASKGADCGDWDLASVLFQIFKDEFVCVSVKANIWYQYLNHRWQEIDSGTTLRKAISTKLRDLYNAKAIGSMNSTTSEEEPPPREMPTAQPGEPPVKSRTVKILNICQRLSRTNDKKNIMTEAKELFYDGSFLAKLDNNPYLLCFKNGVYDFKERDFRRGRPDDNISMCTNIEYIQLKPLEHQSIVDEIHDFMNKLFPEKPLCEYMWDHLASTLLGTCTNQTFNMYIGVGSNGKSVLVSLMELILGDYKGDVPLTLVTEKRGKVGGLAPEIVQLKGKRFAVMQEPSKGDKINEGIMKQLTSGTDQLQGRAPYMPQTISFKPQFKLIVTCNVLLEIKSNDHGTWRRIRAVPFKSLFTDNPVDGDPEKPFQFKLDKYIDEKFESWKEVFAAMLVKRATETNGIVKDCDIVLAKSNEYRQSQDYLSEFINDRVTRDPDGKIKKTELNNEFSMWYMSNYGGRGPGPKDLHDFMDKEFGRQRNQNWIGVKIRYDHENDFASNASDDGDVDNVDIRVDEI